MSDTTRSKADFKCLRERVGLSQQDVASALGVNIRSVKRWEFWSSADLTGNQTTPHGLNDWTEFWSSADLTGNQTDFCF